MTSVSSAKMHSKGGGTEEPRMIFGSIRRPFRKFKRKLNNLDPVKLAYLRTSFIFAISILITWTPSSINRVHSVLYPKRMSYGLNMASAVVLPLQGVWNAVIYISTSWATFKEEWEDIRARWRNGRTAQRLDDVASNSVPESGSSHHPRRTRFEDHASYGHRMANVRVIRGGSL